MQLILMRHAKSDWHTAAGRDFDRPLNQRGLRDAPRMGRWLAGQGLIPDKIVSSPAMRARQTVLAVAEELGYARERIIWNDGIYEAPLDNLLNVVRQTAAECRSLLLVGHNPGFDALACYLTETAWDYSKRGKLITTAAVAVFEIPGTDIHKNCARLVQFMRPRDLKHRGGSD